MNELLHLDTEWTFSVNFRAWFYKQICRKLMTRRVPETYDLTEFYAL